MRRNFHFKLACLALALQTSYPASAVTYEHRLPVPKLTVTALPSTSVPAGAVASLSATSLSFGDVGLGAADIKSVLLTNTGSDTLTLSAAPELSGDNAYSVETNCADSLSAGQTCTTNVTFAPLTAGAKAASLRFLTNASAGADQAVSITGSGKSLLSTLALFPAAVDFGSVLKGGTASAEVTIRNTSSFSTPLTVGAVAAPFSKAGTTCNATLAAGASCTVSLSYAPTVDADYSTGYSLPLTWGAALESASVALAGTVVDSAVSTSSLVFADTAVGVTTAPQTVTLSNPGSAPLTLGTPKTDAPYATSYTCGSTLAAGQTCLVSVTFTPTVATSQAGTLTIPTSAGDKVITLSGKGVSPLTELSLSPVSAFSFGGVSIGSSSTQTLTLKNTGTLARNLTVGNPAAPFSMTTTCGATLAAGATCTITSTFAPMDGQSYASGYSIPLTWGPLNETTSIALSGTGKDPYFSQVSFLSHLDGIPGGTGFSATTGQTITAYSTVVSAAQSESNGTAAYFANSLGYLGTTATPSLAGALTMEAFIYPTTVTSSNQAIMSAMSGTGQAEWAWYFDSTTIRMYYGVRGAYAINFGVPGVITPNKWHHVAVSRDTSNVWRFYLDGALLAPSVTVYLQQNAGYSASANLTSPKPMGLNGTGTTSLITGYAGFMDEVRITSGVARYTGNTYTVPTAPFPSQ